MDISFQILLPMSPNRYNLYTWSNQHTYEEESFSSLVNLLIFSRGGARNGKTRMFLKNIQMSHFMESFNLDKD